ncbi:MAG: TonB-dependent receptor, partial [Pseudomonadota bacterium]
MLTAISSIAMAAMSCPAQAQTESAQPIAVEAQPLEEALVAIGRKFGVSITAPDALTQGKTAPALSGVMTVDQALQRVLAGSGLTYRIADNGGFIITPGDTSSNEGQNLIIVRGEGRARSLQETASSVSVTTEDDLAKRAGPQSLRSVLEATPGVQFNAVNNDGPTVRGSDSSGAIGGSGIFVGGARGRTTLEIDGREANLTELAFGSTGTWDIKQIEVFVGPQTTNRGRNAVAGAFYIETNDPTQYYEAAGRVVVGNFDTKNYAGVLSGPIIQDQLAFRVAAEVTEHDSFVDLALPLAGGDTTNPFGDFGFDPRESPSTNIRAKLLLTPDAIPDLEAKLTFNYFDTRRPQTELVDNARSGGRQINNPLFSIFTNEVYAGTLDLKYQLSDAFQLRNSTVYTDNTSVRLDSVPGSAGLFTEELVNKFYIDYDDPNSRLSGLFGVYYLRSWQDADLVIVPDVFEVLLDGNATSLGIFGEIDIPLTERLTLTTGLRYQRDDKDRSGGQPLLDINFDQTFEAWLP